MNKTMALVGACALLLTGTASAETLRFATEGAYPPFNYVDADNKLHGFDIDITHAYLMIASLCYFYNSNRHTLSSFLAVDLADKQAKADWLAFISDLALRGLRR